MYAMSSFFKWRKVVFRSLRAAGAGWGEVKPLVAGPDSNTLIPALLCTKSGEQI